MTKTRVGVVGVGHIGRHHARILAGLPDVELVGVVDHDPAAAQRVADAVGTTAHASIDDFFGKVDAVTVAVPTSSHCRVAAEFLKRGVATLVEKPLAFNLDEAREMIRLSRKHGAVLQVGHSERYNPAWLAAAADPLKGQFVEARRFSKYPFRSLDVSVVFDMMIHDIDLTLAAVDSPLVEVTAVGASVLSPSTDWASAHLRFANGAEADLAASRVHHDTVRRLRLWADDDLLEVDFQSRETVRSRLSDAGRGLQLRLPNASTKEEKDALLDTLFEVERTIGDPAVEPLKLEIADYLRCVREQAAPIVGGDQGFAAVAAAAQIEAAIHQAAQQPRLRRTA
ncbi:MAG: Gfo/Idh/MocA family protein [Planctomycetia bacterium]